MNELVLQCAHDLSSWATPSSLDPAGEVRVLSQSSNPRIRHILTVRFYEHIAYSTFFPSHKKEDKER